MSHTSATPFESTVHTTNIWMGDLANDLGWQDRHGIYHSLRAVLHALRDRLTVDDAAALGAQLPLLIRGVYYEGWHPHGKPLKERKKEAFLTHVTDNLGHVPEVHPEIIVRAVFRMLANHVSRGEIERVKNALPEEIRELWIDELRTVWS